MNASDAKPNRVPPGQRVTTGFPVLHEGEVPVYRDLGQWNLRVFGLVERVAEWSYEQFMALPRRVFRNDIHCVTSWSRLDNEWEGVAASTLMERVRPKPEAKFVMLHAEHGFTTNLPLEDFLRDTSFLAIKFGGEPLSPEHGFPVRMVVPHLYFWKSAKWLRGIEFMAADKPGFWERNGYHMYGDPWLEERYDFD